MDQELHDLFREKVPEIKDGIIEVKAIARIPGVRSKIAVATGDGNVDAVERCVGDNGQRIQDIVKALDNESIDLIPWENDPVTLVTKALGPAKLEEVTPCPGENRMRVRVSDDQYAMAYGRDGINVRLASRLTGWDLDLVLPGEHSVASAGREASDDQSYPVRYQTMGGSGTRMTVRLYVEEKPDCCLPITLDERQAITAFSSAAGEEQTPDSVSVIFDLLDKLGGTIRHILIDDLKDHYFQNKLVLDVDGRTEEIACRTSDAIAISMRFKKDGQPSQPQTIRIGQKLVDCEALWEESKVPEVQMNRRVMITTPDTD